MAAAGNLRKALRLDPFCYRQFDRSNTSYAGTQLHSVSKEEFVERVNRWYQAQPDDLLRPGYAPFCKHIFVPNDFVSGCTVGAVAITDDNRRHLHSGYQKRRDSELAVLARWFNRSELLAAGVPIAEALWFDVILYSKQQIVKENEAMNDTPSDALYHSDDWEWGIVSIKAQTENYEVPMSPITMMRNSLGKEEGGSGVPIDRDAYEKSVQYWEQHAVLQ